MELRKKILKLKGSLKLAKLSVEYLHKSLGLYGSTVLLFEDFERY